MEFWDSFSKTVSDAADYTVKEAGKLTGIAKLKYRIASTRARLDTLYAGVGRLKYEEQKGTAPSGANSYDELFAKIETLEAEIVKNENELAKLRNVRLCVACRSVIGIDMTFCPRCGAKQPPAEEPEKDDNCDCGCCCGDDCCGDDCCGDDCCDDDCCDDDCCDNNCCCDDCCDDDCDCGCDCGDKSESGESTSDPS
jgi:hypothetical protein